MANCIMYMDTLTYWHWVGLAHYGMYGCSGEAKRRCLCMYSCICRTCMVGLERSLNMRFCLVGMEANLYSCICMVGLESSFHSCI